jgi:hypothetical protein
LSVAVKLTSNDVATLVLLQERLGRAAGIAVAEDDDVALGGVAASAGHQFLVGHFHRPGEVRHVADLHRVDLGLDRLLV